jgi:hypothetical protein
VRYIHLNPVRAGLTTRPEEWLYSNYLEFVDLRNGMLFDPESNKEQFNTPHEFREFVEAEIQTEIEKRLAKYYLE